jgi:hypothetical protein
MGLSRRRFFQAGALAVTGLGGYFFLNGDTRSALMTHIEHVFGREIAAHADSSVFLDDYMMYLQNRLGQRFWQLSTYYRAKPKLLPPLLDEEQRILDEVVKKFLQSTNVVKSFETNTEFRYFTLYDPYFTPCLNQMSANWL